MDMISEIKNSLGISEYEPAPHCFSVVGNVGGYFQNVKKIVDIKRTMITIRCGQGEVFVFGEDLFVAAFDGGDLSIKGRIKRIEVK